MKWFVILTITFVTACASPCRRVIGVRYSETTRIVDYAISGGGASEVGIKEGDKLVFIGTGDTFVKVVVVRENNLLTFNKVRLTCVDDLHDEDTYWGEIKP